jgi:hypothetical protein
MQLAASAPTNLDHDAQLKHAKDDDDDSEGAAEADDEADDDASDKAAQDMEIATNDNIYNKLSCSSARRMIRRVGRAERIVVERVPVVRQELDAAILPDHAARATA